MPTLALLAVPIGQLLAGALACGINLYATVATLALVSRYQVFGWTLPIELRGLENGVVIASAAGLYLFEFLIDKVPYADSAWDAIHTIVRPLAAAALVGMALVEFDPAVQFSGAVIAGAVAFLAHATKAGIRVVVNRRRRAGLNVTVSLLEDLLAVSIALAALMVPAAALFVAGATLVVFLLVGPLVWRAAALGMRALAARIRGFFGRTGWRTCAELPWRLRPLIEPEPLGSRPPVVARAGLTGKPGFGAYRNGWIVFDDHRRIFLYHGFLRPHRLDLAVPDSLRIQPGILADTLEVDDGQPGTYHLFLLKDGPGAEQIAAELRNGHA